MKTTTTKLIYCVLIAISFAVGKANAQMVFIPDTNFRNWIAGHYPGAIVGDSLDTTNAGVVNETSVNCGSQNISDLTGVEYFVNATWLEAQNNLLTAFPPLPPQASGVGLINNYISSITSIPGNITTLYVLNNQLTSIDSLPVGLVYLDCSNNLLTTLPTLPDSLYGLWCDSNNLTTLPAFPSKLHHAYCEFNQLTSLTSINSSLKFLFCQGNNLSSLPALPNSLTYLHCSDNNLSSLPPLPDSMETIYCLQNNLTGLPTLPSQLQYLFCANNSISCLPFLPSALYYLSASGNGITCLPNLPSSLGISDIGFMVCPIHYSACDTFPVIKGKVFNDSNNNGVFDAGEILITQRLVSLSPNTWNGLTDNAGEFTAVVDTGNYNMNVFTHKHDSVTTPIQTANVPNYFDVDTDNVIGLYMPPNINDLEVHLISVNPPRPGFNNQINIVYANTGSTTLTGSVSFTFDNNYMFDSAAPPQFSQSGNMLTWNFNNLPPYTTGTISTYFYLPPGVLNGTVLTNTVTVNPFNNDTTPADNLDTLLQTVVGSCDPNDKTVEPSVIATYLPNPVSEPLKYTIRFQNTGTYLAETVTIIDTLDARLNPATFHLISSSHLCNVQIYGNLLSFTFNNINLPDSNANEINSHGYVQFTINMNSGANVTAPLINNAGIYFDFNPPVRTPDAVVQFMPAGIENIDGNTSLDIYPVPVHDVLYVSLNKPVPANTLITISDMQGRMVGEKNTNHTHDKVIPITVSKLSQGVYLLRIDGVVKRFVKL